MPKIHVASNRPVGDLCRRWMVSRGFEHTSPEDCDIYFSILSSIIVPEILLRGKRAFNFHPAILPEYNGSPVYTMVIANGEKESGVTIHEMTVDVDAGPIVAIEKFALCDTDTATAVRAKAEKLIFDMFKHWAIALAFGQYLTRPNVRGKLYRRKDLEPMKDLTRLVRALTLEGKESAYYVNSRGERVYIEYQ